MLKKLIGLALLAAPATGMAQTAPAGEVRLELIGRGSVEAVAKSISASASIWERAPSQSAADAARVAKQARIASVVADLGIAPPKTVPGQTVFPPVATTVYPAPPPPVVTTAPPAPPRPTVPPPPRQFSSSATLTFTVSSQEQLTALRTALAKIDVWLSNERPVIGDDPELRRRARDMAIANARKEADSYARSLGLATARLISISESGNGVFPGIQRQIERMATSERFARGPQSFPDLNVDVTLIVQFVLAP